MQEAPAARPNDGKYRLWRLSAAGALAVGLVAMAIPILPTAPFILAAAYGFTRGSERIHRWAVDPDSLGTGFAEWRRRGVVPPVGKLLVLLFMAAGFLVAWAAGLDRASLIIEGIGLILVGGYVLTRPSPAKRASLGGEAGD